MTGNFALQFINDKISKKMFNQNYLFLRDPNGVAVHPYDCFTDQHYSTHYSILLYYTLCVIR